MSRIDQTQPDIPVSQRVLILAPGGSNAIQLRRVLIQANLEAQVCETMTGLCREMEIGAGALLLTGEALAPPALETLHRLLTLQPDWSRLPVIILAGRLTGNRQATQTSNLLKALPGSLLLERPIRPFFLIDVLENALEARLRQCQVRDLLARQAEDVAHRDRFLAMLGHELRNPLAPIRNLLDVFKLEQADLPEHLQEGLDLMSRQAGHLNHLVNELLDVSRVTQGRITLRREPVDLAEVVKDALFQVEPLIRQQHHRLHRNLPEAPLRVTGDFERLVQVAANLIGNAAKYTPSGGDIWIDCLQEQDQALLRVQDNGPGIPPQLLPRLFEPFVQAEQSLDRAPGGLGLGLALVRQLVEDHGGRIEVHSAGTGRGSRFSVFLPTRTQRNEWPTCERPTGQPS